MSLRVLVQAQQRAVLRLLADAGPAGVSSERVTDLFGPDALAAIAGLRRDGHDIATVAGPDGISYVLHALTAPASARWRNDA